MVKLDLYDFPFTTFGWSGSCGAPFPWARWAKWHQAHLLDIHIVKLVHTQMFPPFFFIIPPPPRFFFFFPPLYDKTLPEHYFGPLDLFFLTPVKPESQLCSGVYKMLFFLFILYVNQM